MPPVKQPARGLTADREERANGDDVTAIGSYPPSQPSERTV